MFLFAFQFALTWFLILHQFCIIQGGTRKQLGKVNSQLRALDNSVSNIEEVVETIPHVVMNGIEDHWYNVTLVNDDFFVLMFLASPQKPSCTFEYMVMREWYKDVLDSRYIKNREYGVYFAVTPHTRETPVEYNKLIRIYRGQREKSGYHGFTITSYLRQWGTYPERIRLLHDVRVRITGCR